MDELRGPGRFKCKFTAAEDLQLTDLVQNLGCKNWAAIARQIPGRNVRQCRERWMNYVNPNLERTPLTAEEECLLEQKFAEHGARWQFIASFFPDRAKNFIKNHWLSKHKLVHSTPPGGDENDAKKPAEPEPAEPESDSLGAFDAFFRDAEKEDIFWERIAADDF
jgi:myb proto-oncogene protein